MIEIFPKFTILVPKLKKNLKSWTFDEHLGVCSIPEIPDIFNLICAPTKKEVCILNDFPGEPQKTNFRCKSKLKSSSKSSP